MGMKLLLLAAEAKGVDLIIGGHSQTEMRAPEKAGETLIVQTGADLANVGKLTLRFGEDKKPAGYSYELVPLSDDIPDDPQAAALAGGGDRFAVKSR
jgi:2',3'-cyclic-nucleotide 2'-phosphodiesterase (5'-nucleotidase family)